MTAQARTDCATPAWVEPGNYAFGIATQLNARDIQDIVTADGQVIGHVAYINAYAEFAYGNKNVTCVVGEITQIPNNDDVTFDDSPVGVSLVAHDQSTPFQAQVLNDQYIRAYGNPKFSYDATAVKHQLVAENTGAFTDADRNLSTPLVVEFSAQVPAGTPAQGLDVQVTFDGQGPVTATRDVATDVTVSRTAEENAAARAVKNQASAVADSAHAKKRAAVSRTKSNARSAVKHSNKLTSKQKAKKLKSIDAKARKNYRALSAARATTRDTYMAQYRQATAPYVKSIEVPTDFISVGDRRDVATATVAGAL